MGLLRGHEAERSGKQWNTRHHECCILMHAGCGNATASNGLQCKARPQWHWHRRLTIHQETSTYSLMQWVSQCYAKTLPSRWGNILPAAHWAYSRVHHMIAQQWKPTGALTQDTQHSSICCICRTSPAIVDLGNGLLGSDQVLS